MNIRQHLLPLLKKGTLVVLVVLIGVGILGYFFQYSERSSASVDAYVNFFFPKNTAQAGINQSFYLDVQALSENPISIATLMITYPRELMTFDQMKTESENSGCSDLESIIDLRKIDSPNNKGTIIYTRGSFKSDADLPKGVFCTGRIYFLGRQEGVGTVSFVPIAEGSDTWNWDVAGPGKTLSPSLAGEHQQMTITIGQTPIDQPALPTNTVAPIPSPTQTPRPSTLQTISPKTTTNSPAPSETTITLKLKLQGVTQKPKTDSQIPMTVQLINNEVVVMTKTTMFDAQPDGTYLGKLLYLQVDHDARYSLLIKGPKHLQKRICDSTPTETVSGTYKCDSSNIVLKDAENVLDFTKVMILSGDIPLQNGIVDAVDIGYIRSNVGQTGKDVVARGDLNYDGIVDTQDFTLIINALSFKYDE